MTRSRIAVLIAALGLLGGWIVANFSRITGDQHGAVRFVLGILFALLILLRPKRKQDDPAPRTGLAMGVGIAGTLLALGGIVFEVNQFEWLGFILILYACLCWSLPAAFGRDIALALVLFYWIHPLPGQVFGSLQLAMQRWAVVGSEWLLHVANVRVWAEDYYLHTGFGVVGVPEACSGMKAGVTVLLSALGVGVLFRFNWWRLLVLVALGLVQVMALNVLRIGIIVYLSQSMPSEWSETVLHDTMGLFLLVSILLIQLEASAWQLVSARRKFIRDGIRRGELERPERASPMPRFWSRLVKWSPRLGGILALALLTAFLIYKSRPYHRQTMRRELIESLMTYDREAADRLLTEQLRRAPGDRRLLEQRAQVQVMRRDFEGALATFARIEGPLGAFETTLRSWALMAVGRAEEAVALIDALPAGQRNLPGVAIVRAEYAAVQGDPELAGDYLVKAAHSAVDIERVRNMFPFLARHEQWSAIARSDDSQPYRRVEHALIAAHACLRVNDLVGTERTLTVALRQWPDDARFLRSLFALALRHPGGEWEDRFANSFIANYRQFRLDQLVDYIPYCFQLMRPDLGWLAYRRLLALDPQHPDVYYTPAQFADNWYRVRRHGIQVQSSSRAGTIDLRPLAALTREAWPLSRLWRHVPLARELTGPFTGRVSRRYMQWTLTELRRREQAGDLNLRERIIYPGVLAAAGQFAEAHRRLESLRRDHPRMAASVLLKQAEFYDRQREWQRAYEVLRQYDEVTELIELQAQILHVNVLLNLNFGVNALAVARETKRLFPGVIYTDLLEAAIWDIFGFKEEALHALGEHDEAVFLFTAARLNAETGRFKEADRIHGVLNEPKRQAGTAEAQPLTLLPAEAAMARRWPPPLTAAELAARVGTASQEVAQAVSPFIRDLEQRMLEWYRAGGQGAASDPSRWAAVGRDGAEAAAALHRLGVNLARQQDYAGAEQAIRMAIERMPDSPILWRILLSITEGDPEVVAAARAACPRDPEIWLAWLVVRTRERGGGAWLTETVGNAVTRHTYAVGTLVRAGDFLLRAGLIDEATMLAREAVERGRGLVAAHMLGLRCAMERDDVEWALSCARQGVEHAVDPGVFYRAIVDIKAAQERADADLITALEYLKEHFPKEREWGQMLGFAYFQRGDAKRALTILESVIAQELRGVHVRSLILAAEAARLEGMGGRAVSILENARAEHPDELSVLNNLVYNLVQHPATVSRAVSLLPQLLQAGEGRFEVLDTAAMVYLRAGRLQEAHAFMGRAMQQLDESNYAALEVRLNSAELALAMGDLDLAEDAIATVRRDVRVNAFLDARARRLLEDVQRARIDE